MIGGIAMDDFKYLAIVEWVKQHIVKKKSVPRRAILFRKRALRYPRCQQTNRAASADGAGISEYYLAQAR